MTAIELGDNLLPVVTRLYQPNGIHGAKHPLRMMAMVPEFCVTYSLPAHAFMLAAAFHDTGRSDDLADDRHGALGVPIMLKELQANPHILGGMLGKQEIVDIATHLVENHCRDKFGTEHLRELEFFKDLDAVERQRFGEVEIRTYRITADLEYWLEFDQALMQAETWQEMVGISM